MKRTLVTSFAIALYTCSPAPVTAECNYVAAVKNSLSDLHRSAPRLDGHSNDSKLLSKDELTKRAVL